jgi:hypothetical protein
MSTPQMQRTIPELLGNIVDNIQQIIRSEFRLAKAEIKEKASRASKPATALAAGLLIGLYGFGFLLLAAVYALSVFMPAGFAALIVGGLLAVASALLATAGAKKLKSMRPAPERTIQTLEENVKWAKDQIK